jgi:hypothetical protein
LANEFELAIHEISHIIDVIDGLHISVHVPIINEKNYYCLKSFHLVLLQSIVDTKCLFWGYEFKWTWNCMIGLFSNLQNLKKIAKINKLPYN